MPDSDWWIELGIGLDQQEEVSSRRQSPISTSILIVVVDVCCVVHCERKRNIN
jgi:hypothetical protein